MNPAKRRRGKSQFIVSSFIIIYKRFILFRAKERENRKKRKRENPTDHSLTRGSRKKLKESTMAKSSSKVGIVVDLSFDDIMDEKSLAKTVKQVARWYKL